jgi:putative endonuclease
MNGRPWILVYYEACLSEKDAVKREKQLKTGYGRAYLKTRIDSFLQMQNISKDA